MFKSLYVAIGLIVAASVMVSARAPAVVKTADVAFKDQSRLIAEPDSRPQKFLTWPGFDLL